MSTVKLLSTRVSNMLRLDSACQQLGNSTQISQRMEFSFVSENKHDITKKKNSFLLITQHYEHMMHSTLYNNL